MVPSQTTDSGYTYVVMLGTAPVAAASSLDAAKDDASAREAKHREGDESQREYHWSEHAPGEWRLTARPEGRNRFSWTQYRVVTIPTIDGGAR